MPAIHITTNDVRPGDWFVTDPHSTAFDRIEWAEALAAKIRYRKNADLRKSPWGHAGVATRWEGGTLYIAQAEPGGAVEVPWDWENHSHTWSTGTGLSVPQMGPAARRYTRPGPWGNHGVPYSFLDYGAIGLHDLRIPAPGLEHYIAASWHMLCSQLTDQSAVDCGVHLFDDDRIPGDVMPMDLGLLAQEHGAEPVIYA